MPTRRANPFDNSLRTMHGLCMATKTISLETDAYRLLKKEKIGSRESFSEVVRRIFAERPAVTCGELEVMMRDLEGVGAGPKRKRRVAV